MLTNSHVIVFLSLIACTLSQTYTQATYNDCGSRNVEIKRLSVTPMPIVQPGTGKLSFTVEAIKPLKGVMKVDLNILRTVSGIKLPIRCYKVQNEDVGSCSYPDLCGLMKRLIKYGPGQCPPELHKYGIDCNCPVNITMQKIDIDMDIEVPEAPEYASWLSVGDFDVNFKVSVGDLYACYDLKFSVKPQ